MSRHATICPSWLSQVVGTCPFSKDTETDLYEKFQCYCKKNIEETDQNLKATQDKLPPLRKNRESTDSWRLEKSHLSFCFFFSCFQGWSTHLVFEKLYRMGFDIFPAVSYTSKLVLLLEIISSTCCSWLFMAVHGMYDSLQWILSRFHGKTIG